MKYLISSVLTVAILGTANAQIFSMGNCNPDIATVQNFDALKFAGTWYEIMRSSNIQENKAKCNVPPHYWKYVENDHVYTIEHTNMRDDNQHFTVFAAMITDMNKGKLKYLPGYIAFEQPIFVLDTDYKNYAVTYSCLDSYQGKLEFIWIISRTSKPKHSIMAQAEHVIKDRNINLPSITTAKDC